MPRRVSLPGADELFRPTTPLTTRTAEVAQGEPHRSTDPRRRPIAEAAQPARGVTGRIRHDQKITVYVSTEELVALETARAELKLYGVNADRGRIVREAIAIALADLASSDGESSLVARLSG